MGRYAAVIKEQSLRDMPSWKLKQIIKIGTKALETLPEPYRSRATLPLVGLSLSA